MTIDYIYFHEWHRIAYRSALDGRHLYISAPYEYRASRGDVYHFGGNYQLGVL